MTAGTPPQQWVTMAAIVATILYLPSGAIVALIAYLCGVTLEALLTLGGHAPLYAGLAAWWLLVFAGSLLYANFVRTS